VPTASNSGATSLIAAHPTRADRCSRQPSAPRAHAGQADISSRNCLTKPRGLFTTQSYGGTDTFCVYIDYVSGICVYYRLIVCKLGLRCIIGIHMPSRSGVGVTTRVGLLPLGGAHVVGDHTGRNAI
jgi:hypothetical protein